MYLEACFHVQTGGPWNRFIENIYHVQVVGVINSSKHATFTFEQRFQSLYIDYELSTFSGETRDKVFVLGRKFGITALPSLASVRG
jgi:hypothetical protein